MNEKQDYEVMVYEAIRWVAFLSVRASSPEDAEAAVKQAYEEEPGDNPFWWEQYTLDFEGIEAEECDGYGAELEVLDGEIVEDEEE